MEHLGVILLYKGPSHWSRQSIKSASALRENGMQRLPAAALRSFAVKSAHRSAREKLQDFSRYFSEIVSKAAAKRALEW